MSGSGGLVLGEDGPVWVLTGRQVAILWPLLHAGAQVLHERGRFAQVDPAKALLRTAVFVIGAGDARRAAVLHSEPPIGASDVLDEDSAQWISASEAGVLMGVCRQTVTRLARSGGISARKVGRSWLIDRAAVERRTAA